QQVAAAAISGTVRLAPALAEGGISADHHGHARDAIRGRLAQDLAGSTEVAVASRSRRTRWISGGIALAVPVAAGLLYATLGNPEALLAQTAPKVAAAGDGAHGLDSPQIVAMVERLAARLADNPDDLDGWTMLGRSYSALGRFEEASRAYAQAITLSPDNPALLADAADVLAMAQGRRFDGEPDRLIAWALAKDPKHVKALALAGTAAFNRKDYNRAVEYWARIREQAPAGSDMAASMDASIAQARQLAGGTVPVMQQAPSAAISGTVRLAPALAGRVAPGDTLFIYARAPQGSRMPVAIVKRAAGPWPAEFRLDDSNAMSPAARLSGLNQVMLEARVSKAGSATAMPGDLRGTLGPVDVGREGVVLEIGSVVE
ncbi:MAG TPA: tetratricopeptide repeat protein, partial [Usitatibacter sp.]|nr:tetratricopeptide repeat protein [Usitatibacter sp.]